MEEKIYQIFVSSTFKDLEQERQEVLAAIVESGNMPVGMEYFPSTSATPFDYIKTMLNKVDYYILILAGKYGSIEPSSGLSYTELEYDYAQQLHIPTMVFLHKNTKILPFSLNEEDADVRSKLEKFRDKASKTLAKMWDSPQELKSQVLLSIPNTIKAFPRTGWVHADTTIPETDNFDYAQVAYHTALKDDLYMDWEHEREKNIDKDITWIEIVKNVFPPLQSMLTKYNIQEVVKTKCGEILDKDFDEIFLILQKQELIRQEVISYPEGGGDVYFCLTQKGVKALLKFS